MVRGRPKRARIKGDDARDLQQCVRPSKLDPVQNVLASAKLHTHSNPS
jgi:hypothetical protein